MANFHLKKLFRKLRWVVRAVVLGFVVGPAMWLLTTLVIKVSTLRVSYPYLLLAIPLGALLITWLYQVLGPYLRSGTAQVIEMINQGILNISNPSSRGLEESNHQNISVKMAPLLLISTIISHLFGASIGKEGAGVQIGASLGNYISHLENIILPKKFEEHSRVNNGVWLISGAGAAFGALFNAPIAGTLFGLQFSSPNVNRTDAYVPCLVSSFTACYVSKTLLHAKTLAPALAESIGLDFKTTTYLVLIAILMGLESKLFCAMINGYKRFLGNHFKNLWEKTICCSILLIALTYLCFLATGDFSLNGLSANLIGKQVPWYVPLFKIILTIASLGCGFIGGEVIPIMVIGSTTACILTSVLGLPFSALAMFGSIGMLSAATNLPLACFMLGLEIFGYANPIQLFMVCMISYAVSGFGGIYERQEKTMALEENWEA